MVTQNNPQQLWFQKKETSHNFTTKLPEWLVHFSNNFTCKRWMIIEEFHLKWDLVDDNKRHYTSLHRWGGYKNSRFWTNCTLLSCWLPIFDYSLIIYLQKNTNILQFGKCSNHGKKTEEKFLLFYAMLQ